MIFHLMTELGAGMDGEIQDVRPHQVYILVDIIRVFSGVAILSPKLFLLHEFSFQSIQSYIENNASPIDMEVIRLYIRQ